MNLSKNHLDAGALRAYLDGELDIPRRQQTADHLATCRVCREQAAALADRSARIQTQFNALTPPPSEAPQPTNLARARLTTRLNQTEKERDLMRNKLFSRNARPVWIGLAIVTLLAVAFAFQPVQAIANSFLGLFRVQQVTIVPISPANFPSGMEDSVLLEEMISNNVQFEGGGETQAVGSAEEAAALAGFAPRLPAGASAELKVQPSGQAAFNVDLALANAVLEELGRTDIQLPPEIDGAQIRVDIPAAVIASFGDCPDFEFDPDKPDQSRAPSRPSPDCYGLVQMPSPTIEAPEGLDIRQIGESMLQLMGMSPEEAASFSANVDWTTTLVVPIPVDEAEYRDVVVDGVQGTFIQNQGQRYPRAYMLIWVKDGMIYALSGSGNEARAVEAANTLQ